MPVIWDPKYRGVMNLWGLAGQGGWASPPPPGYVRPEDSAMAKIFWPAAKSMTSGVIDTIADRLSGARALRGILTGKPRELLSVVPESDYFGLTDPTQNKSFGFWGDMLVRPDVAKLATIGLKGLSGVGGSVSPNMSAISPTAYREILGETVPAANIAVKSVPLALRKGLQAQLPELQAQLATSGRATVVPAEGQGLSMGLASAIRPTRMYKEGLPDEFRGVGGIGITPEIEAENLGSVKWDMSRPTSLGFYNPNESLAAIYRKPELRVSGEEPPFWNTVRHERVHSAIERGVRDPEVLRSLPIPLRVPAVLRRSVNPFIKGTGTWVDEATAQALGTPTYSTGSEVLDRGSQLGRMGGPWEQSRAARDFLFNPDNPVRQYYADYVKDISPSASAVFSGLPTAAKAVSTTSKVAPAILLLDALRRGGESTNTEGF